MDEPRASKDNSIEVALSALTQRITENKEYERMLRDARVLFDEERDRRYAEVKAEQEKAIKIKEQADRDALELARQIQTYKDEKANDLRDQLLRERGNYASHQDLTAATEKIEETLKPIILYVSQQQGRVVGVGATINYTHILFVVVISIVGLYLTNTRTTAVTDRINSTPPQIVVVPAQPAPTK